MRITHLFTAAGALIAAGAGLLTVGTAQAEQSSTCKAAAAFMGQQVDAGLDPIQYTPEELHWLLENETAEDCDPVPQMLQDRMNGTALPVAPIPVTCHSVMDWMIGSLDAGESFTDEEMDWGRSYFEGVPQGETCDDPPRLLMMRSYGHRVEDSEMKQFLADAMDKGEDGSAALEIAFAYFDGTMVSKDTTLGYSYLVKASELGSPHADWELSSIYYSGLVEDKGEADGIAYLKRAAEGGIPFAMMKLATFYDDGTGGVKKDPQQAYHWYNEALDHGMLLALPIVADRLLEGNGAASDRAAAIALARSGARAGEPLAMLKLVSFMLQVDNAKQLMDREGEINYWLDKSVASGNPAALKAKNQYGAQIAKLFEPAVYTPPPAKACPRVLKCDVYYSNNGRQSQKVCAEYPSWRACGY